MKKVLKYGTGETIPEGAEYLCTKLQLKIEGVVGDHKEWIDCWLVWHYFLVEVEE